MVFLTQFENKNSRTRNRKLATNPSRSLALIFSISLSSFIETKFLLSNEISLCDLLDVFLFSWCYIQTGLGSNQPTQIYSLFPPPSQEKFGGGTVKKAAKSEKLFEGKRWTILIGSERPLRYRWLVILPHVKQLYAILTGCVGLIRRAHFYKWALWNEIPVLRIKKSVWISPPYI